MKTEREQALERRRRPIELSPEDKMIAERLLKLRTDNGQTQETVANLLGTDRRVINMYEKSAVRPPLKKLIELAKIYNVSMDYLCGLSDEKHEQKTFEINTFGLSDRSIKKLLTLANNIDETIDTSLELYTINKLIENAPKSLWNNIGKHLKISTEKPDTGFRFDREKMRERLFEEYIIVEELKRTINMIRMFERREQRLKNDNEDIKKS